MKNVEKTLEKAARPITMPIGIIGMLGLLAIIASPVVWIWSDWDDAWKVGLTGLIVLVASHLLLKLVKTVFKETYDNEVAPKLGNYNSGQKKSRFQQKMEEALSRRNKGL